MKDKTGNYRRWLRGWRLGSTGLIRGNFKNFYWFPAEKKKTRIKNVWSLPGPWSSSYILVYIVVFSLAIKNTALIQWQKLKKGTPSIAHIDMLNGIIPGHALKISWESDRIEGRLLKHCSAASITNQILKRKRKFLKQKMRKNCEGWLFWKVKWPLQRSGK